MKTIYLVRHAKTGDAPTDMDRILTVTGIERSHKLGQYLKLMSTKVDVFHASMAQRAIQTAEILAPYVKRKEKDIVYSRDLYLAGEDPYFKILVALNQKVKTVMFVGHNQMFTNVVRFFIPDFYGYLRTSECYCIDIIPIHGKKLFTAKKEIRFSKLIR